jgi:hypothetical protein
LALVQIFGFPMLYAFIQWMIELPLVGACILGGFVFLMCCGPPIYCCARFVCFPKKRPIPKGAVAEIGASAADQPLPPGPAAAAAAAPPAAPSKVVKQE